MPFNISRFQGEIDRNGISRTDHFEVIISPPAKVNNIIRDLTVSKQEIESQVDSFSFGSKLNIAESIMLRARSVNLPGRTVTQTEYFEHGSEYKMSLASNYQNVNIGMLCSESLIERDFFLEWQDLAIGNHRSNKNKSRNGFYGTYYENYVSRVIIKIYNERGMNTKNVTLEEAFPTSISDIQYDWGSSEHAIIPIDFSYRYFYEDREETARLKNVRPEPFGKGNKENKTVVAVRDVKNNPAIATSSADEQGVSNKPNPTTVDATEFIKAAEKMSPGINTFENIKRSLQRRAAETSSQQPQE